MRTTNGPTILCTHFYIKHSHTGETEILSKHTCMNMMVPNKVDFAYDSTSDLCKSFRIN